MDLRAERTKRNIINAFITLRAKKPIEKITVKELSEIAVINKATFYLHYKDLYDLSESLENELIENCLAQLPSDSTFLSKEEFRQMTQIFQSQSELFGILFSGSRMENAIEKIEFFIKSRMFKAHPEYQDDLVINIRLSAIIYGCFHTFFEFQDKDFETVISVLSDFASSLKLE